MTAEPSPDLEAPPPAGGRRPHMANVRRAVIKLGTNVLTRESGEMSLGRIHALIEDIVDLHRRGLQLILVSSGAISMGMDRLGLKKRPAFLPDKQACAAVGQIRLMSVYEQAFHRFGIPTAQILLTEDDFSSRVRYLNLRNTLGRLLDLAVIPIVNENDTVSTSEIEVAPEGGGLEKKGVFGDNDRLSALVASKLGADLLVVLSDVDGLYPPGAIDRVLASGTAAEPAGAPIPVVHEITPEIEAMAKDSSGRGRGGMLSKLRSIKVALDGGSIAVIANGTRPGILPRILQGEEVGTIFLSRRKIPSRKRWLAHATAPAGKVVVNAGARKALLEGRSSLLFAGVVRIEGEWKRGDAVTIADESGSELARGIVNYGSKDALPFLGKRSAEIAEAAGKDYEELVTRDNIVVLRED